MAHHMFWRLMTVLALLGSATAWAQNAPQGAAASPATGNFKSLAAIDHHFDRLLEESQNSIQRQRLAALEAFLDKAPEADRENVLTNMIQVAMSLKMYDRVVSLSDTFLEKHADSALATEVSKLRLIALARSKRLEQARKGWDALLASAEPEQLGDVLQVGLQLVEFYLNAGDVEGARSMYETMQTQVPESAPEAERKMVAQQLQQIFAPRLDALKQIGQTPPPLEGTTLSGEPIDLANYKGKVVLLDFWATWCGPCVESLPHLKEVYRKYHDQGLEVIGISLDADEQALRNFIRREGLEWPQVWDNANQPTRAQNPFGGSNTRRYDLTGIPATYLLDRDGRIARVRISSSMLEDAVAGVLARPATNPASQAGSQPQTRP